MLSFFLCNLGMKRLLSFIWKILSMPSFDAFKEGAEQGDAPAQFNLALLYYDGQGVPQNYTEAVKWFRKAADQDYVKAMHNLGLMYAKGQGVPQDYVEAHKWSDLAASRHRPGKKRDDSVHDRNFLAKRMTPAQIAEAQRLAREWRPRETSRTIGNELIDV